MRIALPVRYKKFGVGKFIGGSVYLHRNYSDVFWNDPFYNEVIHTFSKNGFDYYNIIKHNMKTGAFTFIFSPNFDEDPEPLISHAVLTEVNKHQIFGIHETILSLPKNNPKIYHHKWLFVKDDYTGFDVQESIKRSLDWMSLEGIDKSRIGNLRYWEAEVLPKLNKISY